MILLHAGACIQPLSLREGQFPPIFLHRPHRRIVTAHRSSESAAVLHIARQAVDGLRPRAGSAYGSPHALSFLKEARSHPQSRLICIKIQSCHTPDTSRLAMCEVRCSTKHLLRAKSRKAPHGWSVARTLDNCSSSFFPFVYLSPL